MRKRGSIRKGIFSRKRKCIELLSEVLIWHLVRLQQIVSGTQRLFLQNKANIHRMLLQNSSSYGMHRSHCHLNSLLKPIQMFIQRIRLFRDRKKLGNKQKFRLWKCIACSQIPCRLDLSIILERYMKQEKIKHYWFLLQVPVKPMLLHLQQENWNLRKCYS